MREISTIEIKSKEEFFDITKEMLNEIKKLSEDGQIIITQVKNIIKIAEEKRLPEEYLKIMCIVSEHYNNRMNLCFEITDKIEEWVNSQSFRNINTEQGLKSIGVSSWASAAKENIEMAKASQRVMQRLLSFELFKEDIDYIKKMVS